MTVRMEDPLCTVVLGPDDPFETVTRIPPLPSIFVLF